MMPDSDSLICRVCGINFYSSFVNIGVFVICRSSSPFVISTKLLVFRLTEREGRDSRIQVPDDLKANLVIDLSTPLSFLLPTKCVTPITLPGGN